MDITLGDNDLTRGLLPPGPNDKKNTYQRVHTGGLSKCITIISESNNGDTSSGKGLKKRPDIRAWKACDRAMVAKNKAQVALNRARAALQSQKKCTIL
ncbi:MAG: hypothetical protein S4CHLAM20_09380 [Chlamydiia bacterium]|nr:hypothetical protein [Chlamydiia bacterium]